MSELDFLADAVDSLNDNELSGRSILNLSIDAVLTDPENPRKEYSEKYIEELAASIDSMGVIQPIVVREIPGDEKNYYCNVGSNRVMAVKWLKENKPESPHSQTIPAILNNDFNELGKLVENIQRNDLKPFEIAQTLQKHIDAGLSSKELQAKLGKDKTWISRHLALNEVAEYTKDLVNNGRITNVEAIINFDKIYKSNDHYAVCLIADLAEEEKLSNGLSRKWLKNLKDKNVNPDAPLIEDEHTTEVFNLMGDSQEAEKTTEVETETKSFEYKDEVTELQNASLQKSEKQKDKAKTGSSPELKKAFKDGLMVSYSYLIDVAKNGGSERGALAKQILISFACNENIALNWVEVSKHADLLQELISIMEAFKEVGYVSPLNHSSQEMVVILSQESLI